MMIARTALPADLLAAGRLRSDATPIPEATPAPQDVRVARSRDDVTFASWKTFLAERGFQPAFV